MKKSGSVKKKIISQKKYPLFSILVLLGVCVGVGWYVEKKQGGGTSNIGVYPTVYSDRHITQNAKISDPRLRSNFSSDVTKSLSNVVSSVQTNNSTKGATDGERGTWLWTDTLKITPEYRKLIISEAKKNGLNSIYLSIDTYLDIYALPAGAEKEVKQKEFDAVIVDFIREANQNGIAVDAEGGWRNWAEEGNTYKAFAVLDYVIQFNAIHTEQFRGMQYDVEPYMLSDFEKNKKKILINFLNLANAVVVKMGGNNMELSFVIPEFYDGMGDKTPQFFYGYRYNYTVDHLLRILDKRTNSKIIVMSYRNFNDGADGAIEISRDEITRANKYNTKVIIAQELGDIEPANYTFYNTSHSYYKKNIDEIEKTFTSEKSFGGIAAHYINALMELN